MRTIAYNPYNLGAKPPKMSYLEDDANTYPIMNYQSRLGFTLRPHNFVYSDIHIMRKDDVLKRMPEWLYQMVWLSHKVHHGILSCHQDGILLIGLNKFKGFVNDFQHLQYSFSGMNNFIPLEAIKSIKLIDQATFKTLIIMTDFQIIHFIVPSYFNSRSFQEYNYPYLDKLIKNYDVK